MNNNPYTPPQTSVDTKEFKRGKWYFAILSGFLVDFIGSMLVAILASVLLTIYLVNNGMSTEQVRTLLTTSDLTSPVRLVSLTIGLVFSVLGGFVCARIANHNEYRYAAIIGLLELIPGLIMSPHAFISLQHLSLTGLSFAALLTGAYLHVAYKLRTLRP